MALENNVNSIHDLDATLPANSDPIEQGAGHLRNIKSALKLTFPDLSSSTSVTADALDNLVADEVKFDVIQLPFRDGDNTLDDSVIAHMTRWQDQIILGWSKSDWADELMIKLGRDGQCFLPGPLSVPSVTSQQDYMVGSTALLPIGSIILWGKGKASIPAGWQIADGTNGTINMVGYVPIPINSDANLGQTQGSQTVTVDFSRASTASAGSFTPSGSTSSAGNHSHGGAAGATTLTTDQIPAHHHTSWGVPWAAHGGSGHFYAVPDSSQSKTAVTSTDNTGGGRPHTHSIGWDGAHTHTLTMNPAPSHTHTMSGTQQISTVQPSVGVYFIQRVS